MLFAAPNSHVRWETLGAGSRVLACLLVPRCKLVLRITLLILDRALASIRVLVLVRDVRIFPFARAIKFGTSKRVLVRVVQCLHATQIRSGTRKRVLAIPKKL